MMEEDRIYFVPGQIVTLKHNLENKPRMLVVEKVTKNFMDRDGEKTTTFLGIKCQWFDKHQVLREAIFSTKDLMHA